MNGDTQTNVAASAQLAETAAKLDAQRRAAADPLPGVALSAFLPTPVTVGPFTIRRLVANDMALLQDLQSPILKQYEKTDADGKLVNNNGLPLGWHLYDVWVLVWLFTNPPRFCREYYLKHGREGFIAEAVAQIGDREDLTTKLLGEVARKVMEMVTQSAETAQKMESAEEQGAEKKSPVTP